MIRCILALLICGYLGAQQDVPLLDRELFFADLEYSEPQLSPDGKYISFLRSFNGVKNIWVKEIDTPLEAACPITSESTQPVESYFWSKESSQLLYKSAVGEPGMYHLFSVQIPDSLREMNIPPKPRDLTPVSSISVDVLALSQESVYVGISGKSYQDVHQIDLVTGAHRALFLNRERIDQWYFDQECQLRLGSRVGKDGDFELLRVDGQSLTPIFSSRANETFRPLSFHKDGKRVYVESSIDSEFTRLVLFDIETGSCEECDCDPEADLWKVVFEEGDLAATVYFGEKARICCKSEELSSLYGELRKEFPEEDLWFLNASADGKHRLILVCSDIEPGVLYIVDRELEKCSLVYRAMPSLETLAPMRPIHYKARDGLEINGYLTLPHGMREQNLPVVVFPHGGPWARTFWYFDSVVQFLANRGYAVFQMNFRGSTGYGKRFLDAGNKEWGDAMQNDISDGVEFLIREGIANPAKIAICGFSYGGFAALSGLAFTPDLYCCGIACCAPSNLLSFLQSPYPQSRRALFTERVGSFTEDADRLKRVSPLFSADRISAPVLLMHGAEDVLVPKTESEEMANALKQLNRKVTYLEILREGHDFADRVNRAAMAVVLEHFLAGHLGGRAQADASPHVLQRLRVVVRN